MYTLTTFAYLFQR